MKKKLKIELSEQVKKTIDEMLASGDKDGFHELTNLINKIAENPHYGNRLVSEKNDIILDRLKALYGRSLDGWCIESEKDPNIVALLIGNKELILLEPVRSGTYKVGDDVKAYKLENVLYEGGYILQFKSDNGIMDIKTNAILIETHD